MACAWKQTAYWKSGETLWTHALDCTTNNGVAYNCLGLAFNQDGKVDEAITAFQEAVKINPDCADAHSNLGLVPSAQRPGGRGDCPLYRKALELKPYYKESHINLGNALVQKGRMDEAISEYQAALEIAPDYAEAHNDLANALLATAGKNRRSHRPLPHGVGNQARLRRRQKQSWDCLESETERAEKTRPPVPGSEATVTNSSNYLNILR